MYNVLNIVFILHLQVIIPATWMVDEGAWEFMADRMGYAVAMMVAYGSETRKRPDDDDGLSTAFVGLISAMHIQDSVQWACHSGDAIAGTHRRALLVSQGNNNQTSSPVRTVSVPRLHLVLGVGANQ